MWKKIRRGDLTRTVADAILSDLFGLAVLGRHASGPLVAPAFDLANKTQRTVYDCRYRALAVQLGAMMVTADDKLANSLAGTPWSANILRLQDLP